MKDEKKDFEKPCGAADIPAVDRHEKAVFDNVYEEESVIESSVNIGEITGGENEPTIINLVEARKEYEEKLRKAVAEAKKIKCEHTVLYICTTRDISFFTFEEYEAFCPKCMYKTISAFTTKAAAREAFERGEIVKFSRKQLKKLRVVDEDKR